MTRETWKDIEGYEGRYRISSHGRVKSLGRKNCSNRCLRDKILKPGTGTFGYLHVILCKNKGKKNKKIHKLVASAFLNQIEGKNQINHKDGNKKNNFIENLEFCTNQENIAHAFSIGLHKSKIKVKDIATINRLLKEGHLQREVAHMFNVTQSRISYLKSNPTRYAN